MAIGQSVAVALLAATSLDIPTSLYTPTQVKRSVSNYGRGSKEQIQEFDKFFTDIEKKDIGEF